MLGLKWIQASVLSSFLRLIGVLQSGLFDKQIIHSRVGLLDWDQLTCLDSLFQ